MRERRGEEGWLGEKSTGAGMQAIINTILSMYLSRLLAVESVYHRHLDDCNHEYVETKQCRRVRRNTLSMKWISRNHHNDPINQ